MNYSISQVARKFGVARSTLLYYDSIGLLSPSRRTAANYRLYNDNDLRRMEQIARFRSAGVGLQEIQKLLGSPSSHCAEILQTRLAAINAEISRLRSQQAIIVGLLGRQRLFSSTRVMTKEKWVCCLRKAGLDDDGMARWHQEFEHSSPEAHQDFLESLGIPAPEIKKIRRHASRHRG